MLKIGGVKVLPLERRIEREGIQHRVDFKAMEVLLRLAASPGVIVTKEELFAAVWPDRHVSENVLPVAVRTLRKALGDDAGEPRFIETVPRVGYRLVARVEEGADSAVPARLPRRRSFLIGAMVILALAGAVAAFLYRAGGPEVDPVVVEVRPIEVQGEDPDLAAVAERIEARLVSTLSREPGTVPRGAGSEPGDSAYVVSGSIRRQGEQISLMVQVTHQATGDIVWSPIFEAGEQELDRLPDRVQQAFRAGVVPSL